MKLLIHNTVEVWKWISNFIPHYMMGVIFRGSWWRHQMETFPCYWPSVRGIHRWPVNSPHKGQWRGALMFSLTCAWTNSWVNNGAARDLIRHHPHYDVIVMVNQGHLCADKVARNLVTVHMCENKMHITLWRERNIWHAKYIFKYIFLSKNNFIFIKSSTNYVLEGLIDDHTALVYAMA